MEIKQKDEFKLLKTNKWREESKVEKVDKLVCKTNKQALR